MPTLELTDQQVVELVKQLPPERKREALRALAADAAVRRDDTRVHSFGRYYTPAHPLTRETRV